MAEDPLVFGLPRLPQPDPTTCGSSVVVVARLMRDPSYAARVLGSPDPHAAFVAEVMSMHARVRRIWPRGLGTTPWAMARALRQVTGLRYVVRWVSPSRRLSAWRELHSLVSAGDLVAVYVGNRWSPRHVVLAHRAAPDVVGAYEPGQGRTRRATVDMFVEGRLRWGWRLPWALVLPRS